jgi:hypothetical protein
MAGPSRLPHYARQANLGHGSLRNFSVRGSTVLRSYYGARRKPLVTLRDAAQYIIKLPKAERELPEWETAIEWLMLVGEHGGDPMVPRIAMMQALQRYEPKAASAPRRKRAKGYRTISMR